MGKSRRHTANATAATLCPCGGKLPYARCCGPLHAGADAASAEALMRSRYSAYALGREDYLLATWHPDTRPAALGLAQDAPATTWLGLRIIRCGPDADDRAQVEFVARYRTGGASAQRLHERSRFVRIAGRWYYLDGDLL